VVFDISAVSDGKLDNALREHCHCATGLESHASIKAKRVVPCEYYRGRISSAWCSGVTVKEVFQSHAVLAASPV
jgi:hypothetical protein